MTTPSMISSPAEALAAELLAAHVTHVQQRLTHADALPYLVSLLDDILQRAAHFKLADVVQREAIYGVVRTYAFEMPLGGGILELVGEIARRLYQEWHHTPPTLASLIDMRSASQWIAKIVELEPLRDYLAEQLRKNPVVFNLLSQWISRLLYQYLPSWLAMQRPRALPLTQHKMFRKLLDAEAQSIEWLSQHIARAIQNSPLFEFEQNSLSDLLHQIWHHLKTVELNQDAIGLTALDVEELVVLAYEDWKHLRQTPFLQNLILSGVDVFFDVYGDYPLTDLIDEVGVTRQHMLSEIARFAPPVIQALERSGDLTMLLHAQLAHFYQDATTLTLLQHALDSQKPARRDD